MSKFMIVSLGVLVLAVGVVRLLPHPDRMTHGFGEFFHTTTDPLAAQMKILPGANEDRFVVVQTESTHCEPDNWDNGCTPPYHYHTFQTEIFEVLKGSIKVKKDGDIITLQEGETATIEPMVKHTFVKSGDLHDDLEVKVTLQPNPGNQYQRFFPNLFGSIRDGGPNLVQILYIFCTNGVRLADIPPPIHEFLCGVTTTVAPLLGYSHEYNQYGWKEEEESLEEPETQVEPDVQQQQEV